MSQSERSGWRDEKLSRRHRIWGFDCPAVDIDWMVIEYDNQEPVALIDYKESHSPRVGQPTDANTNAFRRLGNRANLPAFTVRYKLEKTGYEFFLMDLNDQAKAVLPDGRRQRLDEIGYVTWLYELRGRKIPASISQAITETSTQDS